jgi:hypothetical protein
MGCISCLNALHTGVSGCSVILSNLSIWVALANQAVVSKMILLSFESQWIKSLVLKWQNLCFEIMEYRRSEDCEPYVDLSLFGEGWQGQVYDTLASRLRGVPGESYTSTENGTSL